MGKALPASYTRPPLTKAASTTSPITVRLLSWKTESKVWSTYPKCPGPRKTFIRTKSFRPAGQEVEVQVLDIDMDKRRISLGMKQCQENPWSDLRAKPSERSRRWKAKSATLPNSACSWACLATSTAWFTCRTSPGKIPAKKP
jgi:hypothetical protein